MEVGDKLICKKYRNIYLTKDKVYTICNISSTIRIICDTGESDMYWTESIESTYLHHLNEFFYIGQELRKLKLEKLLK